MLHLIAVVLCKAREMRCSAALALIAEGHTAPSVSRQRSHKASQHEAMIRLDLLASNAVLRAGFSCAKPIAVFAHRFLGHVKRCMHAVGGIIRRLNSVHVVSGAVQTNGGQINCSHVSFCCRSAALRCSSARTRRTTARAACRTHRSRDRDHINAIRNGTIRL